MSSGTVRGDRESCRDTGPLPHGGALSAPLTCGFLYLASHRQTPLKSCTLRTVTPWFDMDGLVWLWVDSRFHHVAQAPLELVDLLPQFPKCWAYRHMSPLPAAPQHHTAPISCGTDTDPQEHMGWVSFQEAREEITSCSTTEKFPPHSPDLFHSNRQGCSD